MLSNVSISESFASGMSLDGDTSTSNPLTQTHMKMDAFAFISISGQAMYTGLSELEENGGNFKMECVHHQVSTINGAMHQGSFFASYWLRGPPGVLH